MGARIALGQVRPKKKNKAWAEVVPSRRYSDDLSPRASDDVGDRRSFFSDVDPNEEDAQIQTRQTVNGPCYLNRGHGHAKGIAQHFELVLPGVPEEVASSDLNEGDYMVDWR